jgi:hypothetical protein
MFIQVFQKWETYSSRKNPASLRHFTLAFSGKYLVKLSQCKKDAKPPAEQPESKALIKKNMGINHLNYYLSSQ